MSAVVNLPAGATSAMHNDWDAIQWPKVIEHVRRLQMRIAKAFRMGKHGKVKSLQWILTHSFSAKLLAVRRVVQNKGSKTPGIDKITWKTSKQKMQAALSLKSKGYKTTALKRIYIPKANGKKRPLSIPAMYCRGMQALYLLSLEPIAETIADKNSYGFRPLRSVADAIEYCFYALAKKRSARYILEADIRACFDRISHSWLVENTLMDKKILKKWLAAGYVERGQLYPTEDGVPQGGLISATLLVVTLSGLERAIKAVVKKRDKAKVNVCIYADDFIITGASREILEQRIMPVVVAFLKERGLDLSIDKTQISDIDQGFDFLSMSIRKYNNKLIIKPAKNGINRFKAKIRETIKNNATCKTENLIHLLNPMIRGRANHYRHVCSKKIFVTIDTCIFEALWRWAKRRHPSKGKRWIYRKYFRYKDLRSGVFSTKTKKKGEPYHLDLVRMSATPIKRHIKIRSDATPFDPAYHKYLDKRISDRKNERKAERSGWWGRWWDQPQTNMNLNDGSLLAL